MSLIVLNKNNCDALGGGDLTRVEEYHKIKILHEELTAEMSLGTTRKENNQKKQPFISE